MSSARRVGAGFASGAVTAGTAVVLRRRPPGGVTRWVRSNYRGDQVSLIGGLAVVAGLVVGTIMSDRPTWPRRLAIAASLCGVGAVGAYDDSHGAGEAKGLHGHLRALASGDVTSGSMKIVGGGVAGLVCAVALGSASAPSRPAVVRDAALVAGTANLVNLLDLRPGRALKAALAAAVVGLGSGLAPPVVGSVLPALPGDLRARTMLGDCGANALGVAVGCVAVAGGPPPVRWALLATVTGLTLISEWVSFTSVIERQPWLRRLDEWGRLTRPDPLATDGISQLIG